MRKRSSPDIIATILEAANGSIGKTKLLTKANLTSSQFTKYIQLLLEKGFLAEVSRYNKYHSYRTTGLGLRYLELYSSIKAVSYINA